MRIDIFIAFTRPLEVKFFNVPDSTIAGALSQLLEQGAQIMATLQEAMAAAEAEAERNTTVDNSVKALLENIAAQLVAAKADPARIQAIADKLRADNDSLAAAVAAHTAAEGEPVVPPTP